MIARLDPRGLGYQTRAVARYMKAARVLGVYVGPERTPYAENTNALRHLQGNGTEIMFAGWDQAGCLPVEAMRWLCSGTDAVYTAELCYDSNLRAIAHEENCRVVVHVNPELYFADKADADALWLPTSWLAERFPGASLVPMPCPTREIRFQQRGRRETLAMLHMAGHPAAADRAGTLAVLGAAQRSRYPWHIHSQSWHGNPSRRAPITVGSFAEQEAMYEDGDVLVAPRRYGGLSLPLLEAACAGLPIVALERERELFPGIVGAFIPNGRPRDMRVAGGTIPVHRPTVQNLRAVVEKLEPEQVRSWSVQARAWAESRSWDVLGSQWASELEKVAGS